MIVPTSHPLSKNAVFAELVHKKSCRNGQLTIFRMNNFKGGLPGWLVSTFPFRRL